MFPALDIQNLSKSFNGKVAVDSLSMRIEAGQIFGLLGPNGAGKSTTINMISGVNRIDKGTVSIFGFDSQRQLVPARQMTGVMHQEIVADAFFTIDKALAMQPGFFGVAPDAAWRQLLVERLALKEHLHKPMNCLSGGMKRRFMLAKALIHKPRLLILDEPTAGVDVELRHALWQFIREINQHQTTILLTTHYLEEAERLCHRIAIMNHGHLIALDDTQTLLQQLEGRSMSVYLNVALTAAPVALQALQPALQDHGLTLHLTLRNSDSVCSILPLLQQLDISIRDIHTHQPSLEDVFLHLTAQPPLNGISSCA